MAGNADVSKLVLIQNWYIVVTKGISLIREHCCIGTEAGHRSVGLY